MKLLTSVCFVLALTSCTKTYTNEECVQEVKKRLKVDKNTPKKEIEEIEDVETIAAILCELDGNNPDQVMKEIDRVIESQ